MDIGDLQDRRLSAEELEKETATATALSVEQRRELKAAFEGLGARVIEEVWNGHWEEEIKVDDPAHRTEMVIEGVVRCYEYLESQYHLIRGAAHAYPILDADVVVNAVRDSTIVKMDVSDGVAYVRVKMRARMHWHMAVERYEEAMGIAPAYADG